MKSKYIFHIGLLFCVIIIMIGFATRSDLVFYTGFTLLGLMFIAVGIKGLIDPLNFDLVSAQKKPLPTSQQGIKWFKIAYRILYLGVLCFGLLMIYTVLSDNF